MELSNDDFELIIFPGKHPPKEYLEKYNKAYDCWRQVWEHAFQVELGRPESIPSDNFTRHDEILALFYKGECAGLTFFLFDNDGSNWFREDSYFKRWPETAFKKLYTNGNKVMISCQFTLNFSFRKTHQNFPWKDLLLGVVVRRFVLSGFDAMCGTTRIAKNVDQASYRAGAVPIIKDMPFADENDRVALLAWYRGMDSHSKVESVAGIVDYIYEKKLTVLNNKFPILQEVKNAA